MVIVNTSSGDANEIHIHTQKKKKLLLRLWYLLFDLVDSVVTRVRLIEAPDKAGMKMCLGAKVRSISGDNEHTSLPTTRRCVRSLVVAVGVVAFTAQIKTHR